MVIYIALIVAIIGVMMAWVAHLKYKELRERVSQANHRLYQLRRELVEKQEQHEQDLLQLKFELLRIQGNLKVTPEMTLGELSAIHPQVPQLLARFHIGGCSSCAVDEEQSLAEAVVLNGRQLEPILAALNGLLAEENLEISSSNGHGNGQQPYTPLNKMPNVQLHF